MRSAHASCAGLSNHNSMLKDETHIDLDFEVDANETQARNEELEDGEITDDEPEEEPAPIKQSTHERIPSPPKEEDKDLPKYDKFVCTRTLYVGDLPKTINEDRLYNIFKKYGEIIDIDIKYLRFGVATFAFIQFIDPISSMKAFENEKFLIIDDHMVKIGFGRATLYNTIFIAKYDPSNLPLIIEKVRSFEGFEWFLTDTKLDQTLFTFESVDPATSALEKLSACEPPLDNLIITYMSADSIKKFISRMQKSGQAVDAKILRECRFKTSRDEYIDFSEGYKHRENDRKRNSSHSDYKTEKSYDKADSPIRESKRSKNRLLKNNSFQDSENSSKSDSNDSFERKEIYREIHQIAPQKINIWNGELYLKRKCVYVSFLYLKGNRRVFDACLCTTTKGEEHVKSLKIEQRMTLDDEQLALISDRIKNEEDCAFGIAIANKSLNTETDLKKYFVDYLSEKNAAGVVNIHDSKKYSLTHVIYLFPVCTFTKKHGKEAGHEIREAMRKNSYLFVVALRY